MEKKIRYNDTIYLVTKENDEIIIYKEQNGEQVPISGDELNSVVEFIGGTVTNKANRNNELKEEITDKIKKGEIKTTDEISEILEKEGLSEDEIKKELEEYRQIIEENIVSDITPEEIKEYKELIDEELQKERKSNQFILSEFSMVNGVMQHKLVFIEIINGEKKEKEIAKKGFEYNQRLIDYLINPSIQQFASSTEHLENDYTIETNITGDVANYKFVGKNNTCVSINDISKSYAKSLKKLVDETEVDKTKDYTQPEEEIENEDIHSSSTPNEDDNYIITLDESEETNEKEEERTKGIYRVRSKPEFKKAGFMSFKYWILITIAIAIGLYFLTKYVILK